MPQPKPRINDNYTPLHHAANCGHTGIVKQLLKKGASVEAIDTNGNTPLHLAAQSGNTGIVELLLTNGASIEALNDEQLYSITSCCNGWSYRHSGVASLEGCLH